MRRGVVYLVALALTALGLSALWLYGQQPAAGQSLEATVVSVEGSVEVKLPGAPDWQDAQAGMKLPVGTAISTGVKSKVELDFDGHAVVIVRRPTIVKVDRFQLTERAVETRLHLKVGSLRAGVVKERIASDFKISTPAVTLSARGTDIADVTHSEKGTEVRMGTEGLLDMTRYYSPGLTRGIPAGHYSDSATLIQVVDAAKNQRTWRSYRYGRTDAENADTHGDPHDPELTSAESHREGGHPDYLRLLFQEALTSYHERGTGYIEY